MRRSRPATRERHVEGGQHPLGDQRALGGGGVALDEDGELVAADPRHRVAEADAGPQPLADRHEEAVAGVVAEAVVDGLEVVEVDEQHGDRLVAALLRARGRAGRGTARGWRGG